MAGPRFRSYIEVSAQYNAFGSKNFTQNNRVYWRNYQRFIQLPDEAKKAAFKVAEDTADRMKAEAPRRKVRGYPSEKRSKANPDRGLRNGIRATRADNGGYIEWNHRNNAPHWEAVEFGARPHIITGPNGISFMARGKFGAANPGTGRPPNKSAKMVKGMNGKLVPAGVKPRKGKMNVPYVKHPGNSPQPYVRSNIAWGEDELWIRVTGLGRKFRSQTTGHFLGDTVHQKARKSLSRGGKKPL